MPANGHAIRIVEAKIDARHMDGSYIPSGDVLIEARRPGEQVLHTGESVANLAGSCVRA